MNAVQIIAACFSLVTVIAFLAMLMIYMANYMSDAPSQNDQFAPFVAFLVFMALLCISVALWVKGAHS